MFIRASLEIKAKNLNFHLKLSDTVTMLLGDGNRGKTCIFNKLQEQANKGKIDNIFFINLKTLYNIDMLKTNADALFLIDDFDAVRIVRPDIVNLINRTGHQVLLLGRDMRGLRVDKKFVYYVSREGCNIYFESVE